MVLKRNSNQDYVQNQAMMHDNASNVPVPTGVENPFPVTGATLSQETTSSGVYDTLNAILEEQRITNFLLKGIIQ